MKTKDNDQSEKEQRKFQISYTKWLFKLWLNQKDKQKDDILMDIYWP